MCKSSHVTKTANAKITNFANSIRSPLLKLAGLAELAGKG